MRTILLLALLAVPMAAQVIGTHPTVIPKSDDSATGELRFLEKRVNWATGGTVPNYVGLKAPASVPDSPGNLIWELPGADSAGCLKSDGNLHLSLGSCSGGSSSWPITTSVAYNAASGVGSPVGTVACSTLNTIYTDTGTGNRYLCTATGTPGTWSSTTLSANIFMGIVNENLPLIELGVNDTRFGTVNTQYPGGFIRFGDIRLAGEPFMSMYYTPAGGALTKYWQLDAANNEMRMFNAMKLAAGASSFASTGGRINGPWTYIDGGVQNVACGTTTSGGSLKMQTSCNDGSGNALGWVAYNSTLQGGTVYLDTTAGKDVFQWYVRPAGDTSAAGSQAVGLASNKQLTVYGNVFPAADNTSYLGDVVGLKRFAALNTYNVDAAPDCYPSLPTPCLNAFGTFRRLQIADATGHPTFMSIQTFVGGISQYMVINDTSSAPMVTFTRVNSLGSSVNTAAFDLSLIPAGPTRFVGLSGQEWWEGHFKDVYITGTCFGCPGSSLPLYGSIQYPAGGGNPTYHYGITNEALPLIEIGGNDESGSTRFAGAYVPGTPGGFSRWNFASSTELYSIWGRQSSATAIGKYVTMNDAGVWSFSNRVQPMGDAGAMLGYDGGGTPANQIRWDTLWTWNVDGAPYCGPGPSYASVCKNAFMKTRVLRLYDSRGSTNPAGSIIGVNDTVDNYTDFQDPSGNTFLRLVDCDAFTACTPADPKVRIFKDLVPSESGGFPDPLSIGRTGFEFSQAHVKDLYLTGNCFGSACAGSLVPFIYAKTIGAICNGSSHAVGASGPATYPKTHAKYTVLTTDENDWAAIQESILTAAANNVSTYGGAQDIMLPPGKCMVNRELNIGDGTSSTNSTYQSVGIIGQNMGKTRDGEDAAGTGIQWTGLSDGTKALVRVTGPISGVKIENLNLNCNDLCGYGLFLTHPFNSRFQMINIHKPRTWGVYIQAQAGFPTGPGPNFNVFDQVKVKMLDLCNAGGFKIGGNDMSLDVSYIKIDQAEVRGDPGYGSSCSDGRGFEIAAADSLELRNILVNGPKKSFVVKPPTGSLGLTFPTQIAVYNSYLETPPEVDTTNGTWGPTSNATGVIFWNYVSDGGGPAPCNINNANFKCMADNFTFFGVPEFVQNGSGYQDAIRLTNRTLGSNGTCAVFQATNTSTTDTSGWPAVVNNLYDVGRMCAKYDSASFTANHFTFQLPTTSTAGVVPTATYQDVFHIKGNCSIAVGSNSIVDCTGNFTGLGVFTSNGSSGGFNVTAQTAWNSIQTVGGVRSDFTHYIGFSSSFNPLLTTCGVNGCMDPIGWHIAHIQSDGNIAGVVADSYGNVPVIRGRYSACTLSNAFTVDNSTCSPAPGTTLFFMGGHGHVPTLKNSPQGSGLSSWFTDTANVGILLSSIQTFTTSIQSTEVNLQTTGVNANARTQVASIFKDINGYATMLLGPTAAHTIVATPGSYSCGGIRYNSSTSKIEVSNDCSGTSWNAVLTGNTPIQTINSVSPNTFGNFNLVAGSGISVVNTSANTLTITNTSGGGGSVPWTAIPSDIVPDFNDTRNIGSSTVRWATQYLAEGIDIKDTSGNQVLTLNKSGMTYNTLFGGVTWLTAMTVATNGKVTANSFNSVGAFQANGVSGIVSQTLTVRNAANSGTCTITISMGIVTASTC